jgi:hypothetical protein
MKCTRPLAGGVDAIAAQVRHLEGGADAPVRHCRSLLHPQASTRPGSAGFAAVGLPRAGPRFDGRRVFSQRNQLVTIEKP